MICERSNPYPTHVQSAPCRCPAGTCAFEEETAESRYKDALEIIARKTERKWIERGGSEYSYWTETPTEEALIAIAALRARNHTT